MKTILLGIMLAAAVMAFPAPSMAQVNISIGVSLPPPIPFAEPPDVIVLPETSDVYVVPDVDADLYFWNGWWWRFWDGRWYRSRYYDRGWGYYGYVPDFYYSVDPRWRTYYREHRWYGHRWDYQPIPAPTVRRNWKAWHQNRYWERHDNWNVRNYSPMPKPQRQELRRQREQQYRQRPDVGHQPPPGQAPRRMEERTRPAAPPHAEPHAAPAPRQRGGQPAGRPEGVPGARGHEGGPGRGAEGAPGRGREGGHEGGPGGREGRPGDGHEGGGPGRQR